MVGKQKMKRHGVEIPQEKIAELCRRHHIRKLSLFGSVLRDDFAPDSDVDVLVEFEPEHVPGLAFARIRRTPGSPLQAVRLTW